MSEPFIAEISILPYNFPPFRWAYCDGQLMPISENTALFALIGTLYGGNGRTNFALPNMQGRAPAGAGTGPGLNPTPISLATGTPTVVLSELEIPPHNHEITTVRSAGTTPEPAGKYWARQQQTEKDYKVAPFSTLTQMSPNILSTTGLSQAHNNMQPYIAIPFCIALFGLFPQRS